MDSAIFKMGEFLPIHMAFIPEVFNIICWKEWSFGFVHTPLSGILHHGSLIYSAGQEQVTWNVPKVTF